MLDVILTYVHATSQPSTSATGQVNAMRIGLVGVGRIGAFHARTLASLDTVDELVVTDANLAAARSPRRGARSRGRRRHHGPARAGIDGLVIAAATPAHAPLLPPRVAAGHADLLREAGGRHARARRSR